jgi:3-oxoacyl-[acyl-carrier-protein] synthase-3
MPNISIISSAITSTGSYLPKKIVTNDELAQRIDTSNEWIFSRVGIKARHIADDTETTSMMAAKAAERAIEANNIITKDDIDGIIVATTTPDLTFPAVAAKVQASLGIENIFAFDIQAVCSGFLYSLFVANNIIKSGAAKNILVIGSDRMSKILDWKDRSTCVLFGDGAGSAILSAVKDPAKGIIDAEIKTDGKLEHILCTTGGVSTGNSGYVTMKGREVFKAAVEKMLAVSRNLLSRNNLTSDDIDWVVPHQANHRIMMSIIEKFGIPEKKLVSTIERHANTSAASIPIAFDLNKDKFKKGDLILLIAAGAGFTWGGALIRV